MESTFFKLEDLSKSSEFLDPLEEMEAEATVNLLPRSSQINEPPVEAGAQTPPVCPRPQNSPPHTTRGLRGSPSSFDIPATSLFRVTGLLSEAPEPGDVDTGPGSEEGFTREP